MKKVFGSLMLASAILIAGTVFAQTPNKKTGNTKTTPQTEIKTTNQKVDQSQIKQQSQPQGAQHQMTSEERAKKSVDRIAEKVKDLSPDQMKKLTELHSKSYAQMDKDREANKDNKEKMQASMKTNFEQMNSGIKNILTPEQYKVYSQPSQQKPAGATNTQSQKPAPKSDLNTGKVKK